MELLLILWLLLSIIYITIYLREVSKDAYANPPLHEQLTIVAIILIFSPFGLVYDTYYYLKRKLL